jgi:hypothetical protein
LIAKIIAKSLFPLLRVAYVGIYPKGRVCDLAVKIYQNRKLIKEERREFEMPRGAPSQAMVEYILRLEKRYTYLYVATSLASINQGVIPSTDTDFFRKMQIETENIVSIRTGERSTIYGSIFDIDEIREKYEEVYGIDYIFPTESLIDFSRRNINLNLREDEAFAILLYDKNSATLAIYQDDIFTYSSHIIFDEDEDASENLPRNDISDIFESELGDDILESAEPIMTASATDDFGSIEDLNDFIASDDSSNFDNSAANELAVIEDTLPEMDLADDARQSNIRRDMLLFSFLKNSFSDFYKNENFYSDFVEKIAILDTENFAKSVAEFVKKELAIEPIILPIEIPTMLCDLAYEEAAL